MMLNIEKKKQETHKKNGLGLDNIGDLSALLTQSEVNMHHSGPLLLNLSLIDEDCNQPRTNDNPGFSLESLRELSATIQLRGIKTPISVRENPNDPGRYIINHGARRFRASKLAGKTHIPGFIDNDYLEADQVIENIQRNELTSREIANYIGRELAKGKKKGTIAKELGKSPAFITQHITLLDLPDPIAKAFNGDRIGDVTVVNELVTAHKKMPNEVEKWLADEEQEITRGSVKLFRESLENKQGDKKTIDVPDYPVDSQNAQERADRKELNSEKLKKTIVQVTHGNRPARLMLTKRPPADGLAWLKYDDDGQEFEANLQEVQLVALIEG